MLAPNPITPPPAPHPTVSKTTLPIAGLHVDVYGLAELPPAAPSISVSVSCLWLHHPRGRRKEDMADIAHQVLRAHYHQQQQQSQDVEGDNNNQRGLIAVAFDQRNHGSRVVDERANEAWRGGNPTHAQDMFGVVSGTVADTVHLLDVAEAYLFGGGGRRIDRNVVLGVSLGGHSAWQLLFAEPRVTAGVMVIGCPDYMNLIQDRARLSKLQTWSAADSGASFFGSRDFPDALVAACEKFDPKGILFGLDEVSRAPSPSEQDRIRPVLDARIRGKKFQVLSGGADKLVPYVAGEPFLDFLKTAASSWYKDEGIYVEDNIYQGVGHEFNVEMRNDATRFILNVVGTPERDGKVVSSKI